MSQPKMTSQKPMGVFERAPELVERDVLAAQDAVDVEAADLDAADAVLLEGFLQFFRVHDGARAYQARRRPLQRRPPYGARLTYASTICS